MGSAHAHHFSWPQALTGLNPEPCPMHTYEVEDLVTAMAAHHLQDLLSKPSTLI
jgi:hypothetical protein